MTVAGPIDADAPRFKPAAVLRRTVANVALWFWSAVSFRRIQRGQWRPVWTRPSRLLIGGAAALVAIALTILLVDALAITQQRQLPQWIVLYFENITDLGRSGWLLVPIGLVLAMLAAISSPALGRTGQLVIASVVARLGFVFVAIGLPGLLVTIVKRMIGRARPYLWESGGPLVFEPFRWHAEYASLPSGHGTTAFAAAFALGALYPRARVPLWAFAGLIAASRVAVSAHYPSDVLAGALIGVLGALVVRNWFAVRRLAFVVASDRTVRALPGPSLRRIKALGRRIVA